MANPVRQVGERSLDIIEEAALQDEERQIREDDAYFRQTGRNRRPRRLDSPLVDNNPSPDIANDGDSYDLNDEERRNSDGRAYLEDNPTEFISGPNQNSRRQIRVEQDLLALHRIDTFAATRPQSRQPLAPHIDPVRQREVEAYNRREQEKEEKEFSEIKEKRIEQSKNAIMELNIEEDK